MNFELNNFCDLSDSHFVIFFYHLIIYKYVDYFLLRKKAKCIVTFIIN